MTEKTAVKPKATIEINQDLGDTIAALINTPEYSSLPIEERMKYIFTAHKNERIDVPLLPQEISVIREYLEIDELEPHKDILISGASHTGKNSIADLAAQILDTEHWDGKEEYDRREKDSVETGKDSNDVDDHFEFDENQRQRFREYDPEAKGKIIQTRLAAINRAEVWDEMDQERADYLKRRQRRTIKEPDFQSEVHAVSFLVEASDSIRADRAYGVYKRKKQEEGIPKSKWKSRDEIAERVAERDEENLEKWKDGHGYYLDNDNPFDGDLLRENGIPVYDFIISTSKRTPLEAAMLLIKRYKEADGFRQKPSLGFESKMLPNEEYSPDEIDELNKILEKHKPKTIGDYDRIASDMSALQKGEPSSRKPN